MAEDKMFERKWEEDMFGLGKKRENSIGSLEAGTRCLVGGCVAGEGKCLAGRYVTETGACVKGRVR